MYRFSYQVNKRRRTRAIKRQSVRHLIASYNNSSNDSSNDENEEQSSSQSHQKQHFEERSSKTMNDDHGSLPLCANYIDDDVDWISDAEYENDTRPLYSGSSVTVSTAIRLINDYYLNINLDKQKLNGLLRLIKSLLPKPNLLPSTWNRMNKSLHHLSLSSTTFLCGDCYQLCNRSGTTHKICVNSNCAKSSRQLRSTEIIEIVRFDIRAQIQSVMVRNVELINKSHLFPSSDICFAEHYQQMFNMNNNQITLIVHSDGAPLVRSSKQSIWPCFASIVELPPPVREFQSNIIILALWASKKKPNLNIFL
jgi:hypothetical protein